MYGLIGILSLGLFLVFYFTNKNNDTTNNNNNINFYNQNGSIKKEKEKTCGFQLMLSIGVFLIILASIIFATSTWKLYSNFIKVLILGGETLLFFALGILLAEIIKATLKKSQHMHWRQIIVLAEIIILAVCGFIPSGKGNTIVNVMVSFVCSLQVESFRVINGNTVATTMCTGNLRSGTELLFLGIEKKDKKIALRSLTYYGINLFFALGAIVGAVATKFLDIRSIFIASALLVIPFIMMFTPSENIEYV